MAICANFVNDSPQISSGKHILPVSKVGKRALLVDDPHSGLLCPDMYALNVVGGLSESLELVVEGVGNFYGSLGVELCGERDLEENVLHDVRSV